VRKQLGLTVPRRAIWPSAADLVRRGVDGTRNKALRVIGRDPPPLDQGRSPHGGFTLDGALRAITRAHKQGFESLSLQGGEPTLWPWLAQLIAEARRLGFRNVVMVTNGRKMADPDYARGIVDSGLTNLVFSLLGADAATHDGLAASPGSFDALMTALANVSALRKGRPEPLKFDANIILSAETVDQLPAEIELLARLGITAATIRLVRFQLFGKDPKVRARLKFPIGKVKAPLRAAIEAADRAKLGLHAEDIPLCLHPSMRPTELERLYSLSNDQVRRAYAPYISVDGTLRRPWFVPANCKSCLLVRYCVRPPADYLENGGETAFTPITGTSIRASIEEDVGPGGHARRRLEGIAASVVRLREHSALTDGEVAELAVVIRKQFASLMDAAATAGDGTEAMASLFGLLGLRPQRDVSSPEKVLARALALARTEVAPAVPTAGHAGTSAASRRLEFAPGYALVFDGEVTIDGEQREFTVRHPRAERAAPSAPGGRLAHALFVQQVCERMSDARRLRWTAEAIEIDRGQGWVVAVARAVPWAVTLQSQ
jgi:MoaA/NifB/PqqE/SkfB family radical SAM enzyme